ncbi:type II toxin-antitoxin system HicB family antitoxin [Microcoleus sp. herbarium19]|uniref:type II toxin-antitoxin system HicB family antitoxin n=1 Tax=unclassified Microcoleus TaxID=2642155 RepID=UPI002FCF350E
MKNQSFTAIIYKEEDMYIAECPEVGTVDQGKTIEKAIANLKKATKLYLEECPLLESRLLKEVGTLANLTNCSSYRLIVD